MAYDVIVIGSGPGGYVAAIRASQLGFKTAIVERENLGGICLNWGCIPTKALLKSAQVLEYIQHAKAYGINAGESSADFDAVIKRSRGVADKMSKGVQFLMKKHKIDVLLGTGKLKAKGQVEVTDKDGKAVVHDAKYIVLATGARAREQARARRDHVAAQSGGDQVFRHRVCRLSQRARHARGLHLLDVLWPAGRTL